MTAVSVIVPTIGRPSLRSAVLSLVAQKNCDVEIIVVVDDPSKRSTVERLLHDVPYVLAITNGLGAAGARNRGLGMATADYVGYLDDDDVWLEDKAWKQIRAIRGSREVNCQEESPYRSEEHKSELQSSGHLVCRLLLVK